LSDAETDEVMALGQKAGLTASQGQMQSRDRDAGVAHTSFRTSSQAWLGNGHDPKIRELDTRISQLTRVPPGNNEPVQLLRYDEGQYYHGHMDWTELSFYDDQPDIWKKSHFGYFDRLATVFWYLNDVAEGGETFFPKHGQPICDPESKRGAYQCPGTFDPDMKTCDMAGLKVPPKRGSVVLWYNYLASGRGDRNSLHAGCPVGKNLTKWSANKWVRTKPHGPAAPWIENHPALKRFGWKGSQKNNPAECQIIFENKYTSSVEVLWLPPSKGDPLLLSEVPPGGRSSQNSFKKHKFVLREKGTDRLSNEAVCRGDLVLFVLDEHFRLNEQVGSHEL